MQLFLLSKPPFLPVSDGKKLSTNLHYLGYALCSMLYVRLARWLVAGGSWLLLPALRWIPEHTQLVLRSRSPLGVRSSLSSAYRLCSAFTHSSLFAVCCVLCVCWCCARSLCLVLCAWLAFRRWLCVLLSIDADERKMPGRMLPTS